MRHSRAKLVLLVLVGAVLACGPATVEPVSIVEPVPLESPSPAPPEELPATPTQWPTPVNQAWRTVALGVERRDDVTWEYGIRARWKPRQFVSLSLGYLHVDRDSSINANDYDVNQINGSVRFQF